MAPYVKELGQPPLGDSIVRTSMQQNRTNLYLLVNEKNKHYATPEAVDLIDKILRYASILISAALYNGYATRVLCINLLSLLSLLLCRWNPKDRLSAQEALQHPFFHLPAEI